jgi:predicted RNA binding protein YcfA (HicA-like mRNA interferase family)
MPALPVLSGQEVVRLLERLGWSVRRQVGSHIVMTRAGSIYTISVPNHKEVARGTLRSIIRSADVTVDVFLEQR